MRFEYVRRICVTDVCREHTKDVVEKGREYREFNAFWSVFQALIHNDASQTYKEKFLFLKQALKGQTAASITNVPVIGDKYYVSINILKKKYDKSASIADILISEIEKIPHAHDMPKAVELLNSLEIRRIHLQQCNNKGD
ncbi:unnamed protein product [Heligmosomoides polygyrus]|uniref:Transposase n=1 Tax=Heligmosomoides polygyrus TaxID=6339 RepID=A0A183FNR6_HELPZ|nr:unnamed protein product [Heligmosomoides polygyrus]